MTPDGKGEDKRSIAAATAMAWEASRYDERVAWRDCGTERYLFRPGQLLIDAKYADRLAEHLKRAGARPARPCRKEDRQLQALGVLRYELVGNRAEAPELVRELREEVLRGLDEDEQRRAVSVNHVLGGAGTWKYGPGDLPAAAPETEVPADDKAGKGTGKNASVSILDTGFIAAASTLHKLLKEKYEDDGDDKDQLYDPTPNRERIRSLFGAHGTFVAGVIRQLAPDAHLDPEVSLDDLGLTDDYEIAMDLVRVAKSDIINLSIFGPTMNDAPPPSTEKALIHLRDHSKAVVVCAAGNDYELALQAGNGEQPMWPAAFGKDKGFDHVIGVAAVDRATDPLEPASFTNRGDWVRACAYGVGELSTYVKGKLATPLGEREYPNATARWSGTSFAVPRVVGAIAAAMDGGLSPRDAAKAVLAAADPGPDGCGVFIP